MPGAIQENSHRVNHLYCRPPLATANVAVAEVAEVTLEAGLVLLALVVPVGFGEVRVGLLEMASAVGYDVANSLKCFLPSERCALALLFIAIRQAHIHGIGGPYLRVQIISVQVDGIGTQLAIGYRVPTSFAHIIDYQFIRRKLVVLALTGDFYLVAPPA